MNHERDTLHPMTVERLLSIEKAINQMDQRELLCVCDELIDELSTAMQRLATKQEQSIQQRSEVIMSRHEGHNSTLLNADHAAEGVVLKWLLVGVVVGGLAVLLWSEIGSKPEWIINAERRGAVNNTLTSERVSDWSVIVEKLGLDKTP